MVALRATRRDINLSSLSSLILLQQNSAYASSDINGDIIGVSALPSTQFPPNTSTSRICPTINEALSIASEGSTLLIAGGTYKESLVISTKKLTLEAWPPGAQVLIEVSTQEPYIHCLDISSDATVKGLTFKHSSKSVANNYAILVQGSATLTLVDSTVSSSSGSGIGIEGGALIQNCQVTNCKSHGIAIFSPIEEEGLSSPSHSTRILNCTISGNNKCGILSKAEDLLLSVSDCTLLDNGIGINLESIGGSSISGNKISDNRDGAVVVSYGLRSDLDPLQWVNDVTGKIEIKNQ